MFYMYVYIFLYIYTHICNYFLLVCLINLKEIGSWFLGNLRNWVVQVEVTELFADVLYGSI